MKRGKTAALVVIAIVTASAATSAQRGTEYSGAFTRSEIAATQCMEWNAFRSKLRGAYSSITLAGSEDPAGRTCTGTAANALCQALHDGTPVAHLVCDGHVWNVDFCQSGWELSADATACYCGGDYAIRPCIVSNGDWGGVRGPSCESNGNRSQVISVACR